MRAWEFIKGVGKLSTLPEQVAKVDQKVTDLSNQMLTCVTKDELDLVLRLHKEATSEKLDLVISLLRSNGGKRRRRGKKTVQ